MQESFILPLPDLKSEIRYLSPEESGRRTPIFNGYRGQFYYDGLDCDAPQQLIDKEKCEPGESVQVLQQFIRPYNHYGKLYVGKKFLVREGSRTVGTGNIIQVFNNKLLLTSIAEKIRTIESGVIPILPSLKRKNELKTIRDKVKFDGRFQIKELRHLDGSNSMFEMRVGQNDKVLGENNLGKFRIFLTQELSFGNEFHLVNSETGLNEIEFVTWEIERGYLCGKITFE